MAQREDIIRRTVYVSDIDQQVLKKLPPFFDGYSRILTYAICFVGFRSLRSSLLVCSSALDRFEETSIFVWWCVICLDCIWFLRLLTVAFAVTQTQCLGLLSSSSLMKVSFSFICFWIMPVNGWFSGGYGNIGTCRGCKSCAELVWDDAGILSCEGYAVQNSYCAG